MVFSLSYFDSRLLIYDFFGSIIIVLYDHGSIVAFSVLEWTLGFFIYQSILLFLNLLNYKAIPIHRRLLSLFGSDRSVPLRWEASIYGSFLRKNWKHILSLRTLLITTTCEHRFLNHFWFLRRNWRPLMTLMTVDIMIFTETTETWIHFFLINSLIIINLG